MIPEQAKSLIGKTELPHIREIEKGAIRRYADAVGNDNPLYSDEEYSAQSRYHSIIAPPGFFGWPAKISPSPIGMPQLVSDLQAALRDSGFPRILDGGISYEFFLPVYAGDKLAVSPRIQDIYEKEGKSGTMMMCSLETTYLNQNGDLVAKSYQTFIAR